MLANIFLLVDSDPFVGLRQSLGMFLIAVFGIVLMFTLCKAVYNLMKGDKDAAVRLLIWIIAAASGLVIMVELTKA